MSFFSLRSLLMVLAMPLISSIKSAEVDPQSILIRNNFFNDITGMNEEDFRKAFGWKDARPGQPSLWHLTQLPGGSQYSKEKALAYLKDFRNYPQIHFGEYRSVAIFQGTLYMLSIKDLKKKLPPAQQLGTPRLRIVVANPKEPQATDVRALQADEQNKWAVFQIASTLWGPLEGGMFDPKAHLTNMIERAVQGEEASISAAPATIFRKYFLPTRYVANGNTDPQNLYLLKNLSAVPMNSEAYQKNGDTKIIIKKSSFNDNDFNDISLALHDDIVVSSGYGGTGFDGEQKKLDIYIKDDRKTINTNLTQMISQVFTAALKLKQRYDVQLPGLTGPQKEAIVNQLAQLLLDAAYKGTLMAAIYAQKPKVFLTLMGGGAFLNPIHTIEKAIKGEHRQPTNKSLITDYGLDVTLIYRPDKVREKSVRNKNDDQKFLTNMANFAAEINNTQNILNRKAYIQDIINYVNQAYDFEQEKNKKSRPSPPQSFISAAQKVQELFDALAQPSQTQPAPSRPAANLDTLYNALTNLTSNLTALQNKLAGR